jgi:CDP-diacylglycerol--glycerol-3-phosphate 3-phosphatidyltransferase
MARVDIPNFLCILRIAMLLPIIGIWMHVPNPWPYLCACFAFAAFTDWLDGFLARKWRVQTPLGAMLDQIADKLLVGTLLILFVSEQRVSVILAVILIMREIWVSGVREYLGTQQIAVPVVLSGKVKTAMQLIGLSCILFSTLLTQRMWHDTFYISGIASLWIAAGFGMWSARSYTKALFR